MHTGIVEYDLTDEHCVLVKKFKVSPLDEKKFWLELTQLEVSKLYYIQKFWLDNQGNLKMGHVFLLENFLEDHIKDINNSINNSD